jgi:alkylation response protein AidB-like acyl-CoA dehydrogenase
MPFFQDPPRLGHAYDDDRVLASYLRRVFPEGALAEVVPSLRAMGELASGPLYRLQLADRLNEPRLVSWDAWGQRVDRIEVSPLWQEAARLAATHGLVATAYERAHGALSRVHQFALVYLFDPSTDVYTCPLAMTDGAAKTLAVHGPTELTERALARLTSRDPAFAWTSGQWMTERTGGSDVGLTETVARPEGDGRYRLYGTKWFTSATTAQMALTLARPDGNPPGGRGLALFYVEVDGPDGRKNGISVNRLKDKLGTRKVPTAELTLDGALATPLAGLADGVKHIAPMLNVTRTWNAVCAAAGMRRGVSLARDYAARRVQFGAALAKKPLHAATLADAQAEAEAGFHLAFYAVELLGREETGALDDDGLGRLRLVTPLAKLVTGKQAVAVLSEVLESFGGAGYVEDTGLPRLLRDAQVLPIWEGTTNVLSLDALKSVAKEGALPGLLEEIARLASTAKEPRLARAGEAAVRASARAARWLAETHARDALDVEAGARRFALTLGRSLALALLVRHAAWALEAEGDARPALAAERFAALGVDLVRDDDRAEAAALANDWPFAAGERATSSH